MVCIFSLMATLGVFALRQNSWFHRNSVCCYCCGNMFGKGLNDWMVHKFKFHKEWFCHSCAGTFSYFKITNFRMAGKGLERAALQGDLSLPTRWCLVQSFSTYFLYFCISMFFHRPLLIQHWNGQLLKSMSTKINNGPKSINFHPRHQKMTVGSFR